MPVDTEGVSDQVSQGTETALSSVFLLGALCFVVFVILSLVLARICMPDHVKQELTSVMRIEVILQKTHPHSWICLMRFVSAGCRAWMFLDMSLDGALVLSLYNTREEEYTLFLASFIVYIFPYLVMSGLTVRMLWVTTAGRHHWFSRGHHHLRHLRKYIFLVIAFGLGVPGAALTDVWFVTVLLFANLEYTKYLVHYERLRYIVEAMVEGPLSLAFQIYVVIYTKSREVEGAAESGLKMDPLLLPVAISTSMMSIVFQYFAIKARAVHSGIGLWDQIKITWQVGVGALPYVYGIGSGKMTSVVYQHLDLVPQDIKKIVHAIRTPHCLLTSLTIKGCHLGENHLIELERLILALERSKSGRQLTMRESKSCAWPSLFCSRVFFVTQTILSY
jgi:hypothetical protein